MVVPPLREREKMIRQRRRPLPQAHDLADIVVRDAVRRKVLFDELSRAEKRGQDVIELMGDPPGQTPDGRESLLLEHPFGKRGRNRLYLGAMDLIETAIDLRGSPLRGEELSGRLVAGIAADRAAMDHEGMSPKDGVQVPGREELPVIQAEREDFQLAEKLVDAGFILEESLRTGRPGEDPGGLSSDAKRRPAAAPGRIGDLPEKTEHPLQIESAVLQVGVTGAHNAQPVSEERPESGVVRRRVAEVNAPLAARQAVPEERHQDREQLRVVLMEKAKVVVTSGGDDFALDYGSILKTLRESI
jgi:hypothetical protein